MGEALLEMYDTMTATEQKELYDFALFIVSRRARAKNPLEEFCGVINDEDADVMMRAIDECRRIEPNEW
ncbi:hypothetical protein [Treponema zioleckii]|uniref:hypothetical protein n=1 Tax=Treponema zioleckii TaxID=331680 RepID=UPI00168B94C3|nr:hypothetical protein [Treponema zioleckii]